jgi:hypothetical protein
VQHTADSYERIAAFVKTSDQASGSHGRRDAHRVPSALKRLGHRPTHNGNDRGGANRDGDRYTADNVDLTTVIRKLSDSQAALQRIAELTDNQLDAVPPDGSFRFCDGQRTLEQVLTSLLKHQQHQVAAIAASTA